MSDFIPPGDPEFNSFQANLVTTLAANSAAYTLLLGDITALTTKQTDWVAKYADHTAAQAAAQAAKTAKDGSRAAYEASIRAIANRIQGAGSAVTDANREAAGLTVRDTVRTPVGVPTSHPVGQVDPSQRFKHTISFRDQGTPTSNAKPAGVRGCELFVKIGGTAPVDASECTYVATDTKTPYTFTFEGDEGGQIAHWMLRWVNTKGEPGPWSETVSATIPG